MATRLKLSASVQNAYNGNTVTPRVKHGVPELDVSLSGYKSVVAAFTGTSSNNVAISISGGTTIRVNSVTQAHPITKANYVPVKIAGFCIRAERAATATAPTGSVGIQVQDFAGFNTDADAELDEGGVFMFHKPTGPIISGAGTLYVKLGGTTGYRVSV